MAGMLRRSICADKPYQPVLGHQNRPLSWAVMNSLSWLAEEAISRQEFHRFLPLCVRTFVVPLSQSSILHPHPFHQSWLRWADQTRIWKRGRYWQGHQDRRCSPSPCLLNFPFVLPAKLTSDPFRPHGPAKSGQFLRTSTRLWRTIRSRRSMLPLVRLWIYLPSLLVVRLKSVVIRHLRTDETWTRF